MIKSLGCWKKVLVLIKISFFLNKKKTKKGEKVILVQMFQIYDWGHGCCEIWDLLTEIYFVCVLCLRAGRGGKEFLSFDLDTVFDVNSIVSEVLLWVNDPQSSHVLCKPGNLWFGLVGLDLEKATND